MLEPPRFDLTQLDPEAYRHLTQLEGLIARHVDPTLYHLIKLRASQINGCAFCLQMHTAEALKHGETPERMVALDGWHESPLYTDRERAVLAWTDELTLIAESHASSEAFEALKPHFSEEEIGWLVLAAVQINSWNRIAISTRARFDPKMFAPAPAAEKPLQHA
ncbi:carboxymuconolactone decarboxylase family protein [Sphingomonas segetis]|jgi:AhpD family alkylhydroperoxidase|uniref:carboxymuconolactone decarboxylase family protein n=1 Tax=Sphingomonas segetis TaxID=1104779 RepID=UPI0012D3343D|nr:carboxymuconolactone decarboxylase family protein [Sphingomonas segetis]